MATKKNNASSVNAAVRAIQIRYGSKVGGDVVGAGQTMKEFVSAFQDVVAESSLVDRFNSRTLDAAAKKVATSQYSAYVGKTEDSIKARKKK